MTWEKKEKTAMETHPYRRCGDFKKYYSVTNKFKSHIGNREKSHTPKQPELQTKRD